MAVMVAMIAVMVVAVAPVVAVSIPVPMMIVLKPTAAAFPIAFEEPLAVMMGRHPYGARIRRAGPISVMPPVVVANRIPVALNPCPLRTGTGRQNSNHAWGWRGADLDADGEVCG